MRRRDLQFFATEAAEGVIPRRVEDAMADIAVIFHWSPQAMADMSISELMEWREQARKRHEPEE